MKFLKNRFCTLSVLILKCTVHIATALYFTACAKKINREEVIDIFVNPRLGHCQNVNAKTQSLPKSLNNYVTFESRIQPFLLSSLKQSWFAVMYTLATNIF